MRANTIFPPADGMTLTISTVTRRPRYPRPAVMTTIDPSLRKPMAGPQNAKTQTDERSPHPVAGPIANRRAKEPAGGRAERNEPNSNREKAGIYGAASVQSSQNSR